MIRTGGVAAFGGRSPSLSSPRVQRLLLFCLTGSFLAVFWFSTSTSSGVTAALTSTGGQSHYAVVFDAGSSGSRVHVYEFRTSHEDGSTSIVDEVFEQVKPGLSSYATDPVAAANSLKSLLQAAVHAVPVEQHSCTPIVLYATAGLRLLGADQSQAILEAVRKLFATESQFKMEEGAVEILDGSDEGVYAWVTLNFLLGNLHPAEHRPQTVAIVDLGGASMQIAMLPTVEHALNELSDEHTATITTPRGEMTVYQHSFLGYGLNEARKTHITLNTVADGITNSPCHSAGASTSLGYAKPEQSVSFESCRDAVARLFDTTRECGSTACSFNGVQMPHGMAWPQVYACSYFADLVVVNDFFVQKDQVTVAQYAAAARHYCSKENEKPHLCFDLTYAHTVLATGFHLTDDMTLKIVHQIDEIEIGWPLGTGLSIVDKAQCMRG